MLNHMRFRRRVKQPSVGDCFVVGQVWKSPRGKLYRVVAGGYDHATRLKLEATLRLGVDGKGRIVRRRWDAVENWVIYQQKSSS